VEFSFAAVCPTSILSRVTVFRGCGRSPGPPASLLDVRNLSTKQLQPRSVGVCDSNDISGDVSPKLEIDIDDA